MSAALAVAPELVEPQRPARVGALSRSTFDACRMIGRRLADVDDTVKATLAASCEHYRHHSPSLGESPPTIGGQHHEAAAWVAVALLIGHGEKLDRARAAP